ncbi:hypothetical protein [Primorskyibacter sp. S187A]|uniref:hypothetical protein n=1 Tax=Primorskyibacter sp. S187A TaxID=3415130 RepID=UPI003C7B0693
MIEVFLASLTGPQIIFLFAVTIIGGFFVGAFAYLTYEVVMGLGIFLAVQFVLFWTSAHLDMVLLGFESGILNMPPAVYIALHHSVQIAALCASFAAGRAFAFRNSR